MSKARIALNADYRCGTDGSADFIYVAAGYGDAIAAAGGLPIILPPTDDEEDIAAALDLVDGLVMVGGGDLDPRRDGFMLHPTVRPLAARREAFDRTLIRLAIQRHMPVFGIGVGMQLLNVAQGGNLMLHIPEDRPAAIPHRDPIDGAHRHALEIEPDSIMERVYGDGEIRVNSMHHMAVDEVAPGFRVTARCPDGIIEAIESVSEDWLAFGTQFHPEAETASALDMRIFEEFIDGVRNPNAAVKLVA